MDMAKGLGKQVATDMEAVAEVTEEIVEDEVVKRWKGIVQAEGRPDKHRQQHVQVAKESAMNLLAWHVATKRRSTRVTRRMPPPPAATREARPQRVVPHSDPQDFNSDQWEARKVIVWSAKGGLTIDKILRKIEQSNVDTSGCHKIWRTGRKQESRVEIICKMSEI